MPRRSQVGPLQPLSCVHIALDSALWEDVWAECCGILYGSLRRLIWREQASFGCLTKDVEILGDSLPFCTITTDLNTGKYSVETLICVKVPLVCILRTEMSSSPYSMSPWSELIDCRTADLCFPQTRLIFPHLWLLYLLLPGPDPPSVFLLLISIKPAQAVHHFLALDPTVGRLGLNYHEFRMSKLILFYHPRQHILFNLPFWKKKLNAPIIWERKDSMCHYKAMNKDLC